MTVVVRTQFINRAMRKVRVSVSGTYCSPMQALLPFPNGCKYFSKRLRSLGSNHRSGRKVSGDGKMLLL